MIIEYLFIYSLSSSSGIFQSQKMQHLIAESDKKIMKMLLALIMLLLKTLKQNLDCQYHGNSNGKN